MARKPSKLIQNTRKKLAKRRVKKKARKLKRKSKRRKRRKKIKKKAEPLTDEIQSTRNELQKLGDETGASKASRRTRSSIGDLKSGTVKASSRSLSAIGDLVESVSVEPGDTGRGSNDAPALADPFGVDSLGEGGSFIDVDGSGGSKDSGASWDAPFGGR